MLLHFIEMVFIFGWIKKKIWIVLHTGFQFQFQSVRLMCEYLELFYSYSQ